MYRKQPFFLWLLVLTSALARMLEWPCSASAGVTLYVATNGADGGNGLSWDAPLLTISNALARTGNGVVTNAVVVSNGTYVILAQLAVTNGITLRSLTGNPADVTIDGGNYAGRPTTNRCISVNHTGAVVLGLTFTNGYGRNAGGGGADFGGGAYISAGELNTCTIRGNSSTYWCGGIYLNGGTLRNCTIAYNTGVYGGGLVASAGSAWNCVIVGNQANGGPGGGILFYATGNPVFYNCLIISNYTANNGGGAEFYSAEKGTMINCTIVSNYAAGAAGGLRVNGPGKLRNCIVYGNSSANASYLDINLPGSGWSFTNCCVGDSWISLMGTNNLRVDPQYVNKPAGDFRLKPNSPGINTGINDTWMEGATDLDGRHRLDFFSRQVDMGAYEYLKNGAVILFH